MRDLTPPIPPKFDSTSSQSLFSFLPMKSLQWRRATHTTERPFFLELRFIYSLYTSGIQTDAFSQTFRASW